MMDKTSNRTLGRDGYSGLHQWVYNVTQGMRSVVEMGCGTGAYLRHASSPYKLGIDAFLPYIEEARVTPSNQGIQFVCANMMDYRQHVTKECEMALFIDSLEHLSKDDAEVLLQGCKEDFLKIAIFIPIGDHDQEPCDGNEMQRHLSHWDVDSLLAMGLEVEFHPNYHYTNPPGKQAAAFAVWVRS